VHATICDIITDLVQNSIEAGATQIELEVSTGPEQIEIRVNDNGKGMDAATLKKAIEPFYSEAGKHDHRRVGLGLPLLIQTAEAAGGKAQITSQPGQGTQIHFTMDARNWDTPPLGNVAHTVLGLMTFGSTYNLILTRKTPTDTYAISRAELAEALGNLEEAGTLALAKEFLESQEEHLQHS
jgi:hypothetical protein